ncbi:MAG: hypothetical protein AAFR61_31250 [Bacteroidota bacterium]
MMRYLLVSCMLIGLCLACRSPKEGKSPMEAQLPVKKGVWVGERDSLKDVFQPLDGHWEGEFLVFTNPEGQAPAPVRPRSLSAKMIQDLGYPITYKVQVHQHYESESPFYQTVRITDTYVNESGQADTVNSSGYNQVTEEGGLLCVVNKPDEQVIHNGSLPAPHTIIWERDLRDPLKVEFFYESVQADTYSILGWGYYGDDDPQKAPKTWFMANYQRVPEE